MRYQSTTTAFDAFLGYYRDRTNAHVAGSAYARILSGVHARVWQAVHMCMQLLQEGPAKPVLQPALCFCAPSPLAYTDAWETGLESWISGARA